MKRQVNLFFGALALAMLLPVPARAEPNAQQILEGIRFRQSQEHRALLGQLRTGDRVIPFRLVAQGEVIRYEFDNPRQVLTIRLGQSRLQGAEFSDHIAGTDISYEDVALRFLYWPNARLEGEDRVLTRKTWRIRVSPGVSDKSQYSSVVVWVDQGSAALLRAEGFDRSGALARRFEVKSSQVIDGQWMLKQMRIERMEGGKRRDPLPTYLEIKALLKPVGS